MEVIDPRGIVASKYSITSSCLDVYVIGVDEMKALKIQPL